MNYYIRVENQEEEVLFEGMVENVPSIQELKTAIENRFYPCCGHYWIATKKWNNFHDDCIIYRK